MKKKLLVVLITMGIVLTGCSSDLEYSTDDLEDLIINGATTSDYSLEDIETILDEVMTEVNLNEVSFTDDLYSDYTLDPYIELNGESESYYISNEGTYVLSGTITSTITINVDEEEDVRLVLNGVSITSADGPAILIISADDVEISVMENTVNNLEDASTRAATELDDYTGVIYSDCDLVLNGTGTLNVTANYNNGVITKDDLKLINLTLNVTSVDDGIIGKDSLSMYQATITVNAEGDALKSTNDTGGEKGYIYSKLSDLEIESGDDGISAENIIAIYDGTLTVTAVGKGIKSETDILIGSGTFTINSGDDAIDSNGDLVIYGGTFTISTEDDALKATNSVTINGGTFDILDCYEGVEAQSIIINSGEITIDASDDGINAASNSSSSNTLTINGGMIIISSYGDCIDVNGYALITGGTIIANGPTSHEANSAFDIDSGFDIDGGTIFTFGNSQMAVAPNETSEQASINLYLNTFYDAGTTVALYDSEGTLVTSLSSLNSFDNVVISLSKLTVGDDYTIEIVGDETIDFTLDTIVTYLNEDGITIASSSSTSGKKH